MRPVICKHWRPAPREPLYQRRPRRDVPACRTVRSIEKPLAAARIHARGVRPMFLRNFWYVAADGPEVARKPLGRMILGEPIVFFRKEDGTPVALEDRCAHRHLPLSMGRLVGDLLPCQIRRA